MEPSWINTLSKESKDMMLSKQNRPVTTAIKWMIDNLRGIFSSLEDGFHPSLTPFRAALYLTQKVKTAKIYVNPEGIFISGIWN